MLLFCWFRLCRCEIEHDFFKKFEQYVRTCWIILLSIRTYRITSFRTEHFTLGSIGCAVKYRYGGGCGEYCQCPVGLEFKKFGFTSGKNRDNAYSFVFCLGSLYSYMICCCQCHVDAFILLLLLPCLDFFIFHQWQYFLCNSSSKLCVVLSLGSKVWHWKAPYVNYRYVSSP